jgi:hypothetical protein
MNGAFLSSKHMVNSGLRDDFKLTSPTGKLSKAVFTQREVFACDWVVTRAARRSRIMFRHRCRGIHSYRSHHPFVLVLQKMTMIDKRAHDVRVAEIHAQTNAGINQRAAVIVRHVYGVAKKVLIDLPSRIIEQKEVQLMNMEGVQLARTVFYDPILDRPLLRHDVRSV